MLVYSQFVEIMKAWSYSWNESHSTGIILFYWVPKNKLQQYDVKIIIFWSTVIFS